ncbi:DNA repair protein RecO [Nakamurella silvestris]|nr:DNA repair protein RecO [Nakamurella silvestris]
MVVYRDTGVVLRVGKLGEADRIITLLTRREGRVRAVAKGVRRTRSKFGARLEPFSHVDVQLFAGRSLDIVTQAESIDPFGSVLISDYGKYTTATAIVETCERLTAEEREPSQRLYFLLVSALRALTETARDPSLVLDAFLLRAMGLAGWAPALHDCARCGSPGPHAAFHVPSGGVLCSNCRSPGCNRPAPASIVLMAALESGDWTTAEAGEPVNRREASGLVAALLQWHLERGLRSLPLVERITPADRDFSSLPLPAAHAGSAFGAHATPAPATTSEQEPFDHGAAFQDPVPRQHASDHPVPPATTQESLSR